MAAEALEYNELIYEGDCHDAFKVWLKAGNADNALTNSNSDWMRLSEGTVDDLCKMVGEFHGAGFEPAAELFANEINAELVKHNLPPKFETRHGNFPSACPQCGGTLPFTYSDVSVTCPFCSSVIRAA